MAELVAVKLKKKGGKCTVIETEGVSRTNNALLIALVKAHLWKRQLEEGKRASVRELRNKINISMRYMEQIVRFNDSAPKIEEHKVNRRQPSS